VPVFGNWPNGVSLLATDLGHGIPQHALVIRELEIAELRLPGRDLAALLMFLESNPKLLFAVRNQLDVILYDFGIFIGNSLNRI
jgi:hypothetical protein